jgi:toxin ParE1/3/4
MRRHLIERFPYAIIYREFDDRIFIVAVAHGLRRPDFWKTRRI